MGGAIILAHTGRVGIDIKFWTKNFNKRSRLGDSDIDGKII
jgi:hypothetical protein